MLAGYSGFSLSLSLERIPVWTLVPVRAMVAIPAGSAEMVTARMDGGCIPL